MEKKCPEARAAARPRLAVQGQTRSRNKRAKEHMNTTMCHARQQQRRGDRSKHLLQRESRPRRPPSSLVQPSHIRAYVPTAIDSATWPRPLVFLAAPPPWRWRLLIGYLAYCGGLLKAKRASCMSQVLLAGNPRILFQRPGKTWARPSSPRHQLCRRRRARLLASRRPVRR
jgi:hypothetical protein